MTFQVCLLRTVPCKARLSPLSSVFPAGVVPRWYRVVWLRESLQVSLSPDIGLDLGVMVSNSW